ncbi:MAG: alpha/beta hydrolase [Actinobacteria bacterium]|nr:alpha/beta hydrolase [Actinomycetota bacterium]
MIARRVAGVATLAGFAAGGAALGWLARRRPPGPGASGGDRESPALGSVRGRARTVESFDGTRLYTETLGPPDAPTLVLVHGYALSLDIWHWQRVQLADRARLVAYDQRGHGRSGPGTGGDYSIHALGRDLQAVLDAVRADGERVVVVGHSLGAMALLSWARQHPDLVAERLAGAVFVNTSGSDTVAGSALSGGSAVLGALQSGAWERALRRGDRVPGRPGDLSYLLTRAVGLSPDADPEQVLFVERLVMSCPNSVKAALMPALTGLSLRDAAGLVRVPALVLAGERDRVTPPGQARRLADKLPDARLVVVDGVGHSAPLEAGAVVSAHLAAFVDGLGIRALRPASPRGGV